MAYVQVKARCRWSDDVEQRKRVSQILIVVILGILAVYTCMNISLPQRSEKGAQADQTKLNRVLMEHAKRTFLTGFVYVENGNDGSLIDWIAETAMELIPLGVYIEGKSSAYTDIEDRETYQMILANQANDENMVDENGKLVQKDGVDPPVVQASAPQIDTSMEKLMNYEYLLGNFYTVDSSTMADPELLNAQVLLEKNMKIDQSKKGPKVLVYHTHSQEAFADSVPGDESTTIVGMGNLLTDLLNDKYGIETIHHKGVYDMVDGKLDRSMAYDLAEPEIQKILDENPSIEVVIDLHRDGVGEQTHLVTEIDGKQTAQIMFFNGMSRTKANGNIGYLANPYIQDNLAFSLQMQLAAMAKYPGFTRHIYLKGYRYNMHFKPKSLLIEAGAQTNTVDEMRNAVTYLADVLDTVLIK